MEKKIPRAIRNNNPLNIRHSNSRWQGLKNEQTDKEFCQFKSLVFGWRAAFKLLTRTYYHTYKLNTIEKIIKRWAPSSENDTLQYIRSVEALTGIERHKLLGLPSDPDCAVNWMAVGMAMAYVESGGAPPNFFPMLEGWRMARADSNYT